MDWKKLLGSITASVDEELRLRNAYLVAENRMLRQQISGRVQLCDSDRRIRAEIGKRLGKKALEEIATVAKSNTILTWHRKFIGQKGDTSKPHKLAGRPRIDQQIEALVVRMARENRSWGYDRMVGALANLGYTISDQTVGNILKRHSIPPGPERKKTVTWREFIRMHMDVLRATDFFTSEMWSRFGLLISSLLCFIHFGRPKTILWIGSSINGGTWSTLLCSALSIYMLKARDGSIGSRRAPDPGPSDVTQVSSASGYRRSHPMQSDNSEPKTWVK